MLTDKDYESMEEARKLYEDIFDSQMAKDIVESLGEDGNPVDTLLFTIFNDAVQQGYIKELPDVVDEHSSSPVYIVSSNHLRTMLYTGLVIGMFRQNDTNKLDSMWVDKIPESE
jgi:hypothetical protein